MSTAICRRLIRIRQPILPISIIQNCRMQRCKAFSWPDSTISVGSVKRATCVRVTRWGIQRELRQPRISMRSGASRHFLARPKQISCHSTIEVVPPNKSRNGARMRRVFSIQKSTQTTIEPSNRWPRKAVELSAISWRWRRAIYCKYSPRPVALISHCCYQSYCWMRRPSVASPIRLFDLARWPFVGNCETVSRMWRDGVSKNGKKVFRAPSIRGESNRLFSPSLGYRPFMMLLQPQVTLLDKFVIQQEAIPNLITPLDVKQGQLHFIHRVTDPMDSINENVSSTYYKVHWHIRSTRIAPNWLHFSVSPIADSDDVNIEDSNIRSTDCWTQ